MTVHTLPVHAGPVRTARVHGGLGAWALLVVALIAGSVTAYSFVAGFFAAGVGGLVALAGVGAGHALRPRTSGVRDTVTGMPSRAMVREMLAWLLTLAERHDFPVVIAVLDVDRRAQANAVESWMTQLRRSDVVGQADADALLLVLPGVTLTQADMLLERLRATSPQIHFAAGLAPWSGERTDVLLGKANDALGQARTAGRWRTIVAQFT